MDAIVFGRSLDEVIVSAHLDSHASALARKGSQFWIAKAKFGLTGVSQLGTLITGDYIAVRPAETKDDRPPVPEGETLHPNTRDPRVPMIRKRLAVTGDLKSENLTSDLYDEELVEAVKRFQARHGMAVDGLIGHHTIDAMDASVDQKGKHEFIGLAQPPFEKPSRAGLAIELVADQLRSVKAGDKVYYREVEVGRVTGYELTGTADKVIIHVDIEQHYAHLVRKNSVFWNASGIDIHAGLFSGAEIHTESLKSILAGGIAFATPDNKDMGKPAKPDARFPLHPKVNDQWLKWKPKIRLEKESL